MCEYEVQICVTRKCKRASHHVVQNIWDRECEECDTEMIVVGFCVVVLMCFAYIVVCET